MRELSQRIVAARLIEDHIKGIGGQARAELRDEMEATGAERVRVTGEDGTDYGSVTATSGRLTATVTDMTALTEWVRTTHPEHMVTIPDPAYVDRLLHAARAAQDPIDPDTGELVPGIEVERGAGGLSVRPSQAARERMAQLLAESGLLRLTD